MPLNCPSCGTSNVETNKFCSNCGTSLAAAGYSPPAFTVPSTDAPVYKVQNWESAGGAQPAARGGVDEPDQSYLDFEPPPPPSSRPNVPTTEVGAQSATQDLNSQAPRTRGAAYTPYSTEAAATLNSTKQPRSWLVPALVVAGLLLAALGVGTGYLVTRGSDNPAPVVQQVVPTVPAVSTPLPESASEEDKVKQVIRQSNEEQIIAWRELNTEVLKGTRIGAVLDENVEMVKMLRSQGMYAVPENSRLDILDVKIDGDRATARTIEVWTVTFYNKSDNSRLQSKGPDTFTETYYLVKHEGKWMVDRLEIDEDNRTPTN